MKVCSFSMTWACSHPPPLVDEFHQIFLLFPHCVLLHVPKQPVRPVLVVSLAPIHLLLTIGLRLSSEGRTNHPCGPTPRPSAILFRGRRAGLTRACLVGCVVSIA